MVLQSKSVGESSFFSKFPCCTITVRGALHCFQSINVERKNRTAESKLGNSKKQRNRFAQKSDKSLQTGEGWGKIASQRIRFNVSNCSFGNTLKKKPVDYPAVFLCVQGTATVHFLEPGLIFSVHDPLICFLLDISSTHVCCSLSL